MARPRRPPPELARGYLKHLRTNADSDFWAVEEVSRRVTGSSAEVEDAWAVILALIAAADEGTLGYVGAGPLEDFVRRFADREIATIEERARSDLKFRACLGTIWLSEGDLPQDILERVVHASGDRIKPLPKSRTEA